MRGAKRWPHSAMDLEMLDARHDITSRWANERVDSKRVAELENVDQDGCDVL